MPKYGEMMKSKIYIIFLGNHGTIDPKITVERIPMYGGGKQTRSERSLRAQLD